MRKVYLVNHAFPPTPEDLAAAALAGAGEVICGLPPALAAAGVDGYGYHEIDDAPAVVPDQVDLWRVRVILAEDGILDDVDAAIAGQPQPIQERWRGAPKFVRSSPLVQGLIEALGPTLGLDAEAVDAILVRAAALAE